MSSYKTSAQRIQDQLTERKEREAKVKLNQLKIGDQQYDYLTQARENRELIKYRGQKPFIWNEFLQKTLMK